jgi:hypothetical protein
MLFNQMLKVLPLLHVLLLLLLFKRKIEYEGQLRAQVSEVDGCKYISRRLCPTLV